MSKKPSQEEILQEIKRRFGGPDNFDDTDAVWTGENFDIDPEVIIAQEGWDSRTLLKQVLYAVIAGHQQNLSDIDLRTVVHQADQLIRGDIKPGVPSDDDGSLLLEIAHRYHLARHNPASERNNRGEVEVAPIVAKVVKEFGAEVRGKKMPSIESLNKHLARRFKNERDVWMSRATAIYLIPPFERTNSFEHLRSGLAELQASGLQLDLTRIALTERPSAALSDHRAFPATDGENQGT